MSVTLLAVGQLKAAPNKASARVFALMAIFVVFYLLNGMSADHIDPQFQLDLSNWNVFLNVALPAIPGLFMVYCFLEFQESKQFPVSLAILFSAQIILEAAMSLIGAGAVTGATGAESIDNGFAIYSLAISLEFLQLVFAGFAFFWTIKGWRSDLVEDRRALRWLVITLQGGLIMVVIVVENFLLPSGTVNDAQAQIVLSSAIAILVFAMLIATMRFEYVSLGNVLRIVTERTDESEPDNTALFDIESFNRQFRDASLYREPGLTIASLAKKLGLPEYKLRAFIHKTLGFRNFNAMLHQYRIEDACIALADKENKNVPVLTIALTVGYQSITPFNNAFREIMGLTPSEYRKRKLAGE
jgi:AraC-like DNA-binding protein